MTHRAQLQHGEAVAFLRQALAVAEVMEGPAAGPARASVMTNLGTAQIAQDAGYRTHSCRYCHLINNDVD
jgi:hypothetical protein